MGLEIFLSPPNLPELILKFVPTSTSIEFSSHNVCDHDHSFPLRINFNYFISFHASIPQIYTTLQ